jgi:hypothetical protein
MTRFTPMPGWLAIHLAACGHELALTLLGAGLLTRISDGDDAVTAFFTNLSNSADALYELREVYVAADKEFPYLLGACAPLFEWAEYSTPGTEMQVRRAASVLANVDFAETSEMAGGDLLGQVRVELEIITRRRRPPMPYLDLETATVAAIMDPHQVREHTGVLDSWCASGVRVMGMALAMTLQGKDPTTVTWMCRDPDLINLAVAAINFAAIGLPDVEFQCADGILTGKGPLQVTTAKEIDSGEVKMFTSPGMSGMDAMEEMARATMAGEEIRYRQEVTAVRDVLVNSRTAPGVAQATRKAMNKRQRR